MRRHIKPVGVFLFLFAVLLILALIAFLFPSGGIRLAGNLNLHFPSPRELLISDTDDYADISYLLDALERDIRLTSDDTVSGLTDQHFNGLPREAPADEDIKESEPPGELTGIEAYGTDTNDNGARQFLFPVQFPADSDTLLDAFFGALDGAGVNGTVMRIVHYGDSQIENDRISSSVRNHFQAMFGGHGIGMFQVVSPVPQSAAVRINSSGSWQRYSPLGEGDKEPDGNRYGILLAYSALTGKGEKEVRGDINLSSTGIGFRRSGEMKELSLIFGYNKKPFLLELQSGGERIDAELYFPSDSLILAKWTLPPGRNNYSISFQGEGSPEIYAFSLDDTSGVAVDNVPMRGSAGLEFAAADAAHLGRMMDILNVRLVLLQFGVNVVPHIVEDYSYYENALVRQLNFLRSVSPGISGIVIGVSDMSRRTPAGNYESYPNVELIRDAQRNAAFRAGFAFWDLYEAMGGRNSMPAWVLSEPPLAQHDHTHFTHRGAVLVGDLLFNALMDGYNKYTGRKRQFLPDGDHAGFGQEN